MTLGPDAGGPRDLVAPLTSGYLLQPATFADRLPEVIDVLRDPVQRHTMGRAGLAAVRLRTWPSICEELLGHYRAVIDERAGRDGTAEGILLAG